MKNLFINPSAPYSAAGACRAKINEAKKTLAGVINAKPQEIFFTSGGTESNNWAVSQATGKHAVIAATEHKSVLVAAKAHGCDIKIVRPNTFGVILPSDIEASIHPDTALVSVQLINNETGVIQSIADIGAICKARRILFHCDAVAGFGSLPIDVEAMHIDLLSVSAHKFYGPCGIGFMFARQGMKLSPLIAGGDQENGRRGGTENLPGICGMGVAAKLAVDEMEEKANRFVKLRSVFVSRLLSGIPGIKIIGEDVSEGCSLKREEMSTIPGIISIQIPGVNNENMIAALDRENILVSGGAACNSASHLPSHVLMSMGMTEKQAFEVIRVSMGRHTTLEEMIYTADSIVEIATK
jgi:cysteine desulfurase